MFFSAHYPVVQCNVQPSVWLMFPCEFHFLDGTNNQSPTAETKHLTVSEFCQLFGVSTGEELIPLCPSLAGFVQRRDPSTFSAFQEFVISEALNNHSHVVIGSGKTVAQLFPKYVVPIEKRSRGPASLSQLSKRKRACAGHARRRKRSRVEDHPSGHRGDEARRLRATKYACARFELEPFVPTSEMVHSPHTDRQPHCLLHAFHMASRLSCPTSSDMEWVMDHFNIADAVESRRSGYNMRTLRVALSMLAQRAEIQPIVIKTVLRPRGGWSWAELRRLSALPGVYLLSCMINDRLKPHTRVAEHFVVFDTVTAQFGDSLAPSVLNLDIEMLQTCSRQFVALSIRAVTGVYQVMRPIEN